jgi:hypothetical protein
VVYAVEVARTAMDDISHIALRQIETADILIALFVESNPTVSYEVGRRQAPRPLVIVADGQENIPLYLRGRGRQSWGQPDVLARIEVIANDRLRELPDFTAGIPDDLKKVIDECDGELQKGLEEALREIESRFEPGPIEAVQHLRGIVSDETSSFFPSSIVEVAFANERVFADPDSPAIVRDYDDGFCRLYGFVDKKAAEASGKLTLTKLLERLQKYLDPQDWDEFLNEQKELTERVVANYGFARAKVPLRINKQHPREEYHGSCYLPSMIAQVIDGRVDGPHKMYLLVVYIEIPR